VNNSGYVLFVFYVAKTLSMNSCNNRWIFSLLVAVSSCGFAGEPLIGSLQMTPARAVADRQAGITVAVLSVSWDRLEPEAGKWSLDAVAKLRGEIAAFRAAGMQISLDLGLQYPPAWVFTLPDSRFKNQYGDAYAGDNPGSNGFNTVFVQANRDRVASYVARFFQEFGTDFQSVRLGWGYYGELTFPLHRFNAKPAGMERSNCYWGFDDLAQGRKPGLPPGIPACPVAGWNPGDPSPSGEAGTFLDWYLGAMQNFHDWQISLVRKQFPGRLCMMYPSWGIRPGWKEAAVAGGLAGATAPERNGEIPRGYDFARFIQGIRDPEVVVYCTWIDAATSPADADHGTDPAAWSPVRYLSALAREHRPALAVWGENTGPGRKAALDLSFRRAQDCGLLGLVWAFDPQLHDGAEENASLKEFGQAVTAWNKGTNGR